MKNSREIKQALIQIAERKGRPHYSLGVVRDVTLAIKNDLDHPLKAEVIAERVLFVVEPVRDVRLDQLIVFCGRVGMQALLAEVSGVHYATLNHALRGNRELTQPVWEKLSGAFEKAEIAYRQKRDTRKRASARDWVAA